MFLARSALSVRSRSVFLLPRRPILQLQSRFFRPTPPFRLCSKDQKPQEPLDIVADLVEKKLVDIGRTPAEPPSEDQMKNIAWVRPKLENIVRVELFQNATPTIIGEMWKEYHMAKYCISAVIEGDIYNRLKTIATRYPIFVVPLPKEEGAMFFVVKYHDDTYTFVSLAQYHLYATQDHPDNAPPALIMKHYSDLVDSKGIALMRGQIDPQQIDVQEAQLLVNQFQLYYLDSDRQYLVKQFNDNPRDFDYNDLLNFTLPKKDLV